MYTDRHGMDKLADFIQHEIEFPGKIARAEKGLRAQRVQEWLVLHDVKLVIDGDFGSATDRGVRDFQTRTNLPVTGVVNEETWSVLVAPMVASLVVPANLPVAYGGAVRAFARQLLVWHPREAGGQNRGPWVRLFMDGQDGEAWAWCAGFVRFVMRQAAEALDMDMPIEGHVGCDQFAQQAKAANLFIPEADVEAHHLAGGALFLNRKTETDWVHIGLVMSATDDVLRTLEGNTNDDGSREGYEVCLRTRGYANKDFIRL